LAQITRFGVTSGGHVTDQAADQIGGYARMEKAVRLLLTL
jgi:hypothetical protein